MGLQFEEDTIHKPFKKSLHWPSGLLGWVSKTILQTGITTNRVTAVQLGRALLWLVVIISVVVTIIYFPTVNSDNTVRPEQYYDPATLENFPDYE